MGDGSTLVVPVPEDRKAVVVQTYEGHFGQRRTESLLLASYWRPGLRQQVAAVVQMCGACDLARQSFNRPHAPPVTPVHPGPAAPLEHRPLRPFPSHPAA